VPISIGRVAPLDKTSTMTFRLAGERSEIVYYPNRINQADDQPILGDEDHEIDPAEREQARTAYDLCWLIKSWELEGSVVRRSDREVLVPEGRTVPLEFGIVREISLTVLSPLMDAIIDETFPNVKSARRLRRG